VKNSYTLFSILIPTYNYNVYPLVEELHRQCSAIKNFTFEIVVFDDGSKLFHQENNQINDLENCSYIILPQNSGLAQTRNRLIDASRYDWILLLDSDVLPKKPDFILNYLQQTTKNPFPIYFGGISYYKNKPPENELLRWTYGIEREEQTAEKRTKINPRIFLSSNTLFAKKVFSEIRYDDSIVQYGYEDLLFSKEVLAKGFQVMHLDNPVWHLKLDSSWEYLQKVRTALQTLHTLIIEEKLDWEDTGITKMYKKLKNYGVINCMLFINKALGVEKWLEKNLLSAKPKVKYLDLYRLLYFSRLNHV